MLQAINQIIHQRSNFDFGNFDSAFDFAVIDQKRMDFTINFVYWIIKKLKRDLVILFRFMHRSTVNHLANKSVYQKWFCKCCFPVKF